MQYPDARRSDTSENLHGQEVPDPYRWLEEGGSDETAAFIAAQNAASEPILAGLPAREAFRELTAALLKAPTRGAPWIRGGRVFAWHSDGQNQPVLVTADSVENIENGRVLLDANTMSDDGTVAVTSASVSPDGALLLYGIADGGSDWRTLKLRDVETGADLEDEIPWTKFGLGVWLPGNRAFSYWCYDAPDGDALSDEMGAGRLMAHTIGEPATTDRVLFSEPDEPRLFARHWPRDDEWFVLGTKASSSAGNDLAAWRHDMAAGPLLQLAEGREHHRDAVGIRDGRLYVVTDEGAPRYRLDAFDLSTGERKTVVAEHDSDVLRDASLTPDGIVLQYSRDASDRAQLATFDGELRDELPLGDGVSVTALHTDSESPTVFASTTSFTDRGTRHVFETRGARLVSHRTLSAPGLAATPATVSRIRTTSTDGSEVPAFLVQPDGVNHASPRPTLIWAYGGFNIPVNPEFRALTAAWVAAGGTLVVPNLRGGGEFGSEWHKGGTKERKQQVFDDLYSIAEHLIATGVTTSAQLALHGRSNGGLLAGAALTQRPELWAAVLPAVGVLDMLRFHRFTIGWGWISDYGDPDDAQAFEYLRAYSPLHNVREVAYPPTLITTADHDDRVVPAHSFKFAAELQRAQTAAGDSAPVVLRVDTRAGHGMGKPKDAAALEYADQLAFAAAHTGLEIAQDNRSGGML